MNKEFKIEEGKVTVINEGGLKLIRNLNPNIREILICENNIEEIENIIKKDNDRIKNNKLDTHDYILLPSLGAAQLANAALQLAFNNIALGISFAGLGIAYLSIHFIYNIKPHRRKLKI